jgi:tRNA-specific 2-thiouridylase
MKRVMDNKKVFVAMSGGVDSAVCAAILLSQGYQVTGIHMETWKDPQGETEAASLPSSRQLAQITAEALGIPLLSLDVKDRFYSEVVRKFIRDYLSGFTPNPCLFCNPQIKWHILQTYALDRGAAYFATGHYARLEKDPSGVTHLNRAVDPTKDQSYVLSMLSQYQLQNTLLPLGLMTKAEVRTYAQKLKLPVADRQDSQDLCFLGTVDYRDFLERFAQSDSASKPGDIVNTQGEVIGQHDGLHRYTIGQRKGIRVASSEPYYVIDKDIEHNRLVVGYAEEAGRKQLFAKSANWVTGNPPEEGGMYDVMIRYRTKPAQAELFALHDETFRLKFNKELRGVTPGQVAVLYRGDECLGGGVIQNTIESDLDSGS